MDQSDIRSAFFVECEDLMEALNEGLDRIEDTLDDGHDDETVNAVFRAVHSIKGAPGRSSSTRSSGLPTSSRRRSTPFAPVAFPPILHFWPCCIRPRIDCPIYCRRPGQDPRQRPSIPMIS